MYFLTPVVLDDLVVILAEDLEPMFELSVVHVTLQFVSCHEVEELCEAVIWMVLVQRIT